MSTLCFINFSPKNQAQNGDLMVFGDSENDVIKLIRGKRFQISYVLNVAKLLKPRSKLINFFSKQAKRSKIRI